MFTEFFLSLSPEATYDLLACVRGPDYKSRPGYYLKLAFTGRARALVFTRCPILGPDFEEFPIRPAYFEGIKKRLDRITMTDIGLHYLGHLEEALKHEEIRSHPIWGGYGEKLRNAIQATMIRMRAEGR